MKKPWLAFLLNLLLARAGFAYLGKWGWGVVNLVAALAVGYVIMLPTRSPSPPPSCP